MNYAICQTIYDNLDIERKKVIEFVSDVSDFLPHIINIYRSAIEESLDAMSCLNAGIIHAKVIETDLKTVISNRSIEDGYYLIHDKNSISCIKKYTVKQNNMFYTSTTCDIKHLASWEIIECDLYYKDSIDIDISNIQNIKNNANILIIGKRGTGKSTLIFNILNERFANIPI